MSARADHSGYVPSGTEPPALIPISENELMVWLEHPTQGIEWQDKDMDAQFSAAPNPKRIEGLAGLGSGHNLRLATQAYRYTAPDGTNQAYDPGYLGHSLCSVIAAAVVPNDLSQLLSTDGPDPFTLSADSQPIPISFRLREAIRAYQAEKNVGREVS